MWLRPRESMRGRQCFSVQTFPFSSPRSELGQPLSAYSLSHEQRGPASTLPLRSGETRAGKALLSLTCSSCLLRGLGRWPGLCPCPSRVTKVAFLLRRLSEDKVVSQILVNPDKAALGFCHTLLLTRFNPLSLSAVSFQERLVWFALTWASCQLLSSTF